MVVFEVYFFLLNIINRILCYIVYSWMVCYIYVVNISVIWKRGKGN